MSKTTRFLAMTAIIYAAFFTIITFTSAGGAWYERR